ncbi:MAG: MBL fold metallo-hydrolase [Gammaproteobacteria bacterium]
MDIQFWGAAGEVTGSCHRIRVGDRQILLDCGLIQGNRRDEARNREPFPFDPAAIDAVILSHAHIDHCGRLPLLVKAGFQGPIYTQSASRDLCRIMLKDAAFLNEKDAEWENRKRERKGLPLVEPLYTMAQAETTMAQFKGVAYGQRKEITPSLAMRLSDAGHMLGSAIVEVWLSAGKAQRKMVFSGDLGHAGAPILRDPAIIEEADLVLLECTYGDRLHRSRADTWREMQEVLAAALDARGNVLIPAFAVGRTQELLYLFSQHYREWGLDRWQIFVDSPLAIEATAVYMRHPELYDAEARDWFKIYRRHPLLPNLHFSRTSAQSMALNRIRSGAIIIAGSGMCDGGRIRHHLKHNVWRRDCHLVIVGYQAQGTLGRSLVDGARHIRLWGETMQVNATVHTLGGFSAHADQAELLAWYRHFNQRPALALVHGETRASAGLAERLHAEFHIRAYQPKLGERLDLDGLGSAP